MNATVSVTLLVFYEVNVFLPFLFHFTIFIEQCKVVIKCVSKSVMCKNVHLSFSLWFLQKPEQYRIM